MIILELFAALAIGAVAALVIIATKNNKKERP